MVKAILNAVGVIGIVVTFSIVKGSMTLMASIFYSVALIIASLFYRVRLKGQAING
jgi:hypothetical protein